jgi:hypothetical protein
MSGTTTAPPRECRRQRAWVPRRPRRYEPPSLRAISTPPPAPGRQRSTRRQSEAAARSKGGRPAAHCARADAVAGSERWGRSPVPPPGAHRNAVAHPAARRSAAASSDLRRWRARRQARIVRGRMPAGPGGRTPATLRGRTPAGPGRRMLPVRRGLNPAPPSGRRVRGRSGDSNSSPRRRSYGSGTCRVRRLPGPAPAGWFIRLVSLRLAHCK